MENKLEEILENCRLVSPYNADSETELIKILQSNGAKHFRTIDDMVFTTNKHGILKGVGFMYNGDFKIWKNSNFGIFKKLYNE